MRKGIEWVLHQASTNQRSPKIRMQPKLKPVQTRDGSKPIFGGNEEGETDDVVHDPKPRSSHCNEPRDGAALDQSFIFDYINPMSAFRSVFFLVSSHLLVATAMDATIRVTLTSTVGGEEHLLSEQTMMGNGATRNGVKRKLERPDLPAGDYSESDAPTLSSI